jgi:hypothetical protein
MRQAGLDNGVRRSSGCARIAGSWRPWSAHNAQRRASAGLVAALAGGADNPDNPWGPNASASPQNPTAAQVETLPSSGEFKVLRNVGSINSGDRTTDGIDLTGTYELRTEVGTFRVDASFTRVMTFQQQDYPGAEAVDYLGKYWPSGSALGNYGLPKWRGSASVTWKHRQLSASIGFNHVDGYKEVGNAMNPIRSYETFDLRFGWSRLKLPFVESAEVLLAVNNIFDEQPSYVATSWENAHDRAIADIRGRMYSIELNAKF